MTRGILVTAVLGGVEIEVNGQTLVVSHGDFLELLRRLSEIRKHLDPRLLKT